MRLLFSIFIIYPLVLVFSILFYFISFFMVLVIGKREVQLVMDDLSIVMRDFMKSCVTGQKQ